MDGEGGKDQGSKIQAQGIPDALVLEGTTNILETEACQKKRNVCRD